VTQEGRADAVARRRGPQRRDEFLCCQKCGSIWTPRTNVLDAARRRKEDRCPHCGTRAPAVWIEGPK